MYGRIINDVAEVGLPLVGTLADGRTVSNYNLLPEAELIAEGWLPCEKIIPAYDAETQTLVIDTAIEQDGTIIVTYKAIDISAN